jgi:hypothetical protein
MAHLKKCVLHNATKLNLSRFAILMYYSAGTCCGYWPSIHLIRTNDSPTNRERLKMLMLFRRNEKNSQGKT